MTFPSPLTFFAYMLLAINASAGPRDELWRKAETAAADGLPRSQIAALEVILPLAIRDRARGEAVRALTLKIVAESSIQGEGADTKIPLLEEALKTAPVEMRSIMEAILGQWYWQYFQENRWRYLQRTETEEASGTDFRTWDLKRILKEIDRHFTAALADEATLQATPISVFDDFLEKGSVPDLYRPTLFDFLAYEALSFYQAGEHGSIKAEDAFELSPDSPIFGDVVAFTSWKVVSTDDISPIIKALFLYQRLLAFHAADADRSAYNDADLARLQFGFRTAKGDAKAERFKASLQRFIDATAGHEISSRGRAALAAQLRDEGDFTAAHAMARRGRVAFPESVGGKRCANLIEEIEAKSAQLETEAVWSAPSTPLAITYRNVTKVFFKAVRLDFDDYVSRSGWSYGGLSPEMKGKMVAAAPALEWNEALPATADYKTRTEVLTAPTSLRPGFYVILASHDSSFAEVDNLVSATPVWVSDLALVVRLNEEGGDTSGFVLKAESGEPVSGAKIRTWRADNSGNFISSVSVQTDSNGRFRIPSSRGSLIVLAESKGQLVASERLFAGGRTDRGPKAVSKTVFFTDRALYRPGQAIHYKGILLRHDEGAAKYTTVGSTAVTVFFVDVSGKEIAQAVHQTNDFGSFGGVFTAPRDRLLGRMSITNADRTGSNSFVVEEYKRPKFNVKLAPPSEAAKLATVVSLTGKAAAYTGAAIGGADVKWRVERAVRLPPWCWWWQPPATQAIAHGTAITDTDGTFKMEFTAAPDRDIPEKNEPTFVFTLHADVTDTTGETRSDDVSINVGYTALQAALTAEEWQTQEKPVEYSIQTKSLDGVPQSVTGLVTIHALQQPVKVERSPLPQQARYGRRISSDKPLPDATNPETWELGKTVGAQTFKTTPTGTAQFSLALKPGIYRALLETKDRFGKTVTARHTVQVVDPREEHYGVKVANHLTAPSWKLEPGEKFLALWGTGYPTGRAFIELECGGKLLQSGWTTPNWTQSAFGLPVTEEMRGGFTVRVTYVRENRAYVSQRLVQVPWTNKELSVKWESFRSKLLPGQRETWTASISGSDAKRVVAEAVATLYDASLDQYQAHMWPTGFDVFRSEYSQIAVSFQNSNRAFQHLSGEWGLTQLELKWDYRSFPNSITQRGVFDANIVELSPFSISTGADRGYRASAMAVGGPLQSRARVSADNMVPESKVEPSKTKIDLSKVAARKNLNETAFFFPQLLADKDGLVKMQFTLPEGLTEWKLLAFAHDQQLRAGLLTDTAVTAKDLMVEPNPPRFVREGDTVEFTVKVSNRTDHEQSGKVKLTFADAETQNPVDVAVENLVEEQAFDLPAEQSRSFSWRITVPEGLGFMTYKAVGATATVSDGEEGFLPVLSRRIPIVESLALPIRGKGTKEFAFKKLLDSAGSATIRNQVLTVQMVSQPAWYAVMALPYLLEYPFECSEQIFNRYYANTLARHIANSDPKIRRIFDQWRNTPAVDSPLAKNQDLKSVMLEETPWVRDAQAEGEARRNVGVLFEDNRLDEESRRALLQLSQRQLPSGLWPWFPNSREDEFISLYIVAGFGRLQHLGVEVDATQAMKALAGLDAWMERRYREIKDRAAYGISSVDALSLYARSFFLKGHPAATQLQESLAFFLERSRSTWTKLDSRQSQAHLALALQRFGDKKTPLGILKSLKERSVNSKEMGMYWNEREPGGWWYRAPIETQAMMIEAFAEITHDEGAVEACKVWLLKQKQTQGWKTTKATSDAVYALLLQGKNPLSSDSRIEVALAGETLFPEKIEAGTGFYQQRYVRGEIKPAMGAITVRKLDDGVSWGGVHWQYLEDVSKVTASKGSPLTVKKALFVRETTSKGPVLKRVTGAVSVGDELVVRLELRTDRDLEYVHLKDQRGSGTEPVNVLSRYRYQDGLGYYETTRDTASHFFINRLPKGTYVFEYPTRVQLKGVYQSGIAEVQCLYAPEFSSHSESIPLEVR